MKRNELPQKVVTLLQDLDNALRVTPSGAFPSGKRRVGVRPYSSLHRRIQRMLKE
ncbi:MAG: hypothetical protein ACXAC5_11850 [Promethearchaeota archaeon]|jgi:hypothetical protein